MSDDTDAPASSGDSNVDSDADPVPDTVAASGDVTARYTETQAERILSFDREGRTAAIAQNREGYAMLAVRPAADGDELERYYGFDMALDHVGELLGVDVSALPIPDAAADMGM